MSERVCCPLAPAESYDSLFITRTRLLLPLHNDPVQMDILLGFPETLSHVLCPASVSLTLMSHFFVSTDKNKKFKHPDRKVEIKRLYLSKGCVTELQWWHQIKQITELSVLVSCQLPLQQVVIWGRMVTYVQKFQSSALITDPSLTVDSGVELMSKCLLCSYILL